MVKEIVSGQHVSHLAKELRCGWDAVNTATLVYGSALLTADTKRLKETTAIGLDETLFVRRGPYKVKAWSTTVCDVVNHQLIDVVPTREFTEVARWLRRPTPPREGPTSTMAVSTCQRPTPPSLRSSPRRRPR